MKDKKHILVAGAGGFIGGHLVNRLVDDGHYVLAADIKPLDEWFQNNSNSNRIPSIDLSLRENADKVTKNNIDEVYMLAADMGGMGYIGSHKVECMLNVLTSANMAKQALSNGVKKYLYASSACVYSSYTQSDTGVSLKEGDAYPADPEPGYGLEKLFSEELNINIGRETPMDTYSPRFHNVYGTHTHYYGGREKAPAAICRKVAMAKLYGLKTIDIWGDGEQTRSFMYSEDAVEGMLRLTDSGYHGPINLGSDRFVTINGLVDIIEEIAEVKLRRNYQLDKPQGVRGRNSDNTLVKKVLEWSPSISLEYGLEKTYEWVYNELREKG